MLVLTRHRNEHNWNVKSYLKTAKLNINKLKISLLCTYTSSTSKKLRIFSFCLRLDVHFWTSRFLFSFSSAVILQSCVRYLAFPHTALPLQTVWFILSGSGSDPHFLLMWPSYHHQSHQICFLGNYCYNYIYWSLLIE